MKLKGPWLVLLCYLLFGIFPLYWKLLSNLNPYFILTNRVIWSLGFAVMILIVQNQFAHLGEMLHDAKMRRVLALSGFLLVVNWGTYIIAINTNHVIDASLAYYLNPIISIILGQFFFKEKLTGLQKLSVVIATAGVLYAVISFHTVPWLALIMGGSFSFYGALKKTVKNIDGVTSLAIENIIMLLPAMLGFVYLLTHGQTASGSPVLWWQWLLLPTTGIITGLPLVIYAKGIRDTSYSLSGILMYINPTMQLLCGIFIFNEPFTHVYAVLFGFVWCAVFLYLCSTLGQLWWQTHKKEG